MASIFFSYAWKDRPIAMRIYEDLVRSGLQVWRDQINGEYGSNIQKQITEKIGQCDGFLLLDSPNSRQSKWVQIECTLYEEYKDKKLAVCLVESEQQTHVHQELINKQNIIKYFDFSEIIMYDNDKKYADSINRLCDFWDIKFKLESDSPTSKDFEDEISTAKITDDERVIFINDFRVAQLRLEQKYTSVESRLKTLISELEIYEIEAITPYLLLSTHLFQNENYGEAHRILTKTTRLFPLDPRGWRNIASIQYNFEDYQSSLFSYSKAIELVEKISNIREKNDDKLKRYHPSNHLHYLNALKLNKAASFVKLEAWHEAIALYNEVYHSTIKENRLHPSLFIGLSDCYEALNVYRLQEHILIEGLQYYPSEYQINVELARLYFTIKNYSKAIDIYKFLLTINNEDFVVYVDLLFLLKEIKNYSEFEYYHNQATKTTPQDAQGWYYLGYIYFLGSDNYNAMNCYYKSDGYSEYYSV
jgi:tetratricopeptide (TPR) repeat protein